MNSLTDQQLLRDYAERRSEAAFAELVRRHVDLVHSAALRMVRDTQLAEDVTQSAFMALARSAPQLSDRPVLSGWLHRTAQNIAAQTVRTDARRRTREQEAAAMNELLAPESDASWDDIAPQLDAALGELSDSDRDALMLRYFERKSAQEIAQVLGVTSEAAQKRVTRAVERLREFFAQRGVSVGASGLAIILTANAAKAAPIGLAVGICKAVLASAGTAGGIFTTLKLMASTKLKVGVVTALVATGIIIALFPRRETAAPTEQGGSPGASASDALTGEGATLPAPRSARSDIFPSAQKAPVVVTPAQIVAGKLSLFSNSRRDLTHALARRHGVAVSDMVEQFFAAAEAGRFEEMQALFDTMSARRKQQPPARDLDAVWGPIHETLGVAQETQKWPAQKLLDYGNAVLDALRPGMVYVGGTDPGRFIPTLLNETSDGERRIVLSQNPLGDRT